MRKEKGNGWNRLLVEMLCGRVRKRSVLVGSLSRGAVFSDEDPRPATEFCRFSGLSCMRLHLPPGSLPLDHTRQSLFHDIAPPPRLLAPPPAQVLVATSTLAWGVNTPAHLVVIKGTEFFDAPTRRYVDFPITDVLQVRAGAVWWCGSWRYRGEVCASQGMRRRETEQVVCGCAVWPALQRKLHIRATAAACRRCD